MDGMQQMQIPRFLGDAKHFPTWKLLMYAQLRARDMEHLVDDPQKKETVLEADDHQLNSAGQETKEKKDADDESKERKAFALVLSCLNFDVAEGVQGCKTTREVWSRLCAIYEQRSKVSKSLMLRKFYNLAYEPGETMAAFLARVNGLVSQMDSAGASISELEVVTRVLAALPDEYDSLRTTWDEKDEEAYTWLNLSSSLTIRELRLKEKLDADLGACVAHQQFIMSTGRAFAGKQHGKQQHGSKDEDGCSDAGSTSTMYSSASSMSRRRGSGITCYNCGKKGHFAKNCKAQPMDSNREPEDGYACLAVQQMNNACVPKAKTLTNDDGWVSGLLINKNVKSTKKQVRSNEDLSSMIELCASHKTGSLQTKWTQLVDQPWECKTPKLKKPVWLLDAKSSAYSGFEQDVTAYCTPWKRPPDKQINRNGWCGPVSEVGPAAASPRGSVENWCAGGATCHTKYK